MRRITTHFALSCAAMACAAQSPSTASTRPVRTGAETIIANDNTVPAGTLTGGVLTL
jgi:hypothetical protein